MPSDANDQRTRDIVAASRAIEDTLAMIRNTVDIAGPAARLAESLAKLRQVIAERDARLAKQLAKLDAAIQRLEGPA